METVTAKEASKILEIGTSRISQLGLAGKIKRVKVSPKTYEYDLDSILEFKATRKAGRPAGSFKV